MFSIIWLLIVLGITVLLFLLPLVLFSRQPKQNDTLPVNEKMKYIKQITPPCHARGWNLKTVENGLRVWQKHTSSVMPWFSGLVYGCSGIVPASLQEIMSAIQGLQLVKEWDPFVQHVSMVTVSSGHDVISVTPNCSRQVMNFLMNILQLLGVDTNAIHSRYFWKSSGDNEGWMFSTSMQYAFPSLGALWYSILVLPLDPVDRSDELECLVTMVAAPASSIFAHPSTHLLTSSRLAGLQDFFTTAKLEGISRRNGKTVRSSTEDVLEAVDFGGGGRMNGQEVEPSSRSSSEMGLGDFLHVETSDSIIVHDNEKVEYLLQQVMASYNAQVGTEQWTLIGNMKGVEISKRPSQPGEKPYDTFKGVGIVNVPIHYVLAYVFSLDYRAEWDDLFVRGRVVEEFHPLTKVSWMEYKAIWPTTGRDFCNMTVLREVSESLYAIVAEATEHRDCPMVKNLVRGEIMMGGFVVRELSSDPPSCQVTYISRADLKGNLPLRLVNRVAQSQPQAVAVLRDKLEVRYKEEAAQDSGEISDLQKQGVDIWVELMKVKETREIGTRGTPEIRRARKTPEQSRMMRSDVRSLEGQNSLDSESMTEEQVPRDLADEREQTKENGLDASGPVVSEENMQLPFVDRHQVDYKTLGNQAAATLMGEIILASKVEISVSEEPGQQVRKEGEWSYQSIEKDVVILRKVSPGLKIHSFLGKGIIKTSPIAVWKAVKNHMTRHVYDKTLKNTKVIKQLDEQSKILYLHHETAQCFVKQARDFVVLAAERIEPEKYVLGAVSIEPPECPVVRDLIRGKVFASGWVIEPVLQDGHLYSMVSYLSQVDFGGVIPTRLLNYIARRQPLCIAYLREYLEKFKD